MFDRFVTVGAKRNDREECRDWSGCEGAGVTGVGGCLDTSQCSLSQDMTYVEANVFRIYFFTIPSYALDH